MKRPTKNTEFYKPLERPAKYPLELTDALHICLWSETGEYKWTIAYWENGKEGYELRFVGGRPLDKRVKWADLKVVIKQGQSMADNRWTPEARKAKP
jgi:hypothetical protein